VNVARVRSVFTVKVSPPPCQLSLFTTYCTWSPPSSARKTNTELPLMPLVAFWTVNPKLLLPFTVLLASGIQPSPAVRTGAAADGDLERCHIDPARPVGVRGSMRTSIVKGSSEFGTEAVVAAIPFASASAYTVVCTAPSNRLTTNSRRARAMSPRLPLRETFADTLMVALPAAAMRA
jgi:hypothetical protein